MGLISYLKNLFRKTIDLADINKSQVVALNKGNSKIKYGTKLNVPDNFVCVLVYKGKITDVFTTGKYKLEVTTLPVLSRVAKLMKPNKKGKMPKAFKADIYYVNLGEIEDETFGNSVVFIKDKQYKALNVRMSGKYSFKIIDAEEFMDAMFTQYGVLRNQVVREEISYWVSKLVAKKVKKNSPTVAELFERQTSCFEGLIDYVNKDVFDCGIKLSRIEVTDVKFPKKVYKKATLSYEENQEQKPTEYAGEPDALPEHETMQEQSLENQSEGYVGAESQMQYEQNNRTYVNYSPTPSNYEAEQTSYVQIEEEPNDEFNDNQQFENKTSNIVIDLDEPIQKTVEYKQCPRCGAYNAKDSEVCFSCKYKF